jgi:hypothetical protein
VTRSPLRVQATNILLVGYPKSGNTWATRLVAELVGCPVAGFWRSDHKEIAVEGEDRESDFRCYKSHHWFSVLERKGDLAANRVIYIVRDPRDVAISGANYKDFRFRRWRWLGRQVGRFPGGDDFFRRFALGEPYRVGRMIRAIVEGDEQVHGWLKRPWRDHVVPYLDAGAFVVRYEDLLADAHRECRRILEYLELNRDDEHIARSIENQSFEKKKSEFERRQDREKADFLRSGRSEQWRGKLSPVQKAVFLRHLSTELIRLGYPTD